MAFGSVAVGLTAPTASAMALRYSTPEWPGHCADGSDDVFVNGLPSTPTFTTFICTAPTLSTEPGPKRSGTASGLDFRQLSSASGDGGVAAVAESNFTTPLSRAQSMCAAAGSAPSVTMTAASASAIT